MKSLFLTALLIFSWDAWACPEWLDERTPRNQKIAIVADDEEIIRHLTSRLLEVKGYTVIEASNGAEVIELYEKTHAVSLIVSDNNMPFKDGIDVARALADKVPFVLMSGLLRSIPADLTDRILLLHKPFTLDDLHRAVAQATSRMR